MNRRIFPDINNFTSRFEAHHAATAGALIVGVLCTDGLDFVSPTHAEQAARSHDAGLPVWHYHFARPEADPDGNGEMTHFWKHAKPHYRPGDRLILDVERQHPDGPGGLVRYVRHIDYMLHRISGIHEAAYMPDSLFRQCGPNLQILSGEFWIASWGGTVRPLGHGRRMIAQQISNGKEGTRPFSYPGIGPCDTNRLQRWYTRQLLHERAQRRRYAPAHE